MNTDLMTPLAFALVSVALIQWWGISTLGFGAYMKKFINFSSPINFFVGFLELIAEFARLISFTFRLFGNMLAGEILLLVMTFLVAVASPIMVVFYGLELFVGAIQAFVFGTLTLVFAVGAVSHHGPEGHDDHGDHQDGAHGAHGEAEAATHH
jgi:F-type H+-transporting ATPase subunit a